MHLNLSAKIILMTQVAVIVALVIGGLAQRMVVGDTVTNAYTNLQKGKNELLVGSLAGAVKWRKPEQIQNKLEEFLTDTDGFLLDAMIIFDAEGDTIFEYDLEGYTSEINEYYTREFNTVNAGESIASKIDGAHFYLQPIRLGDSIIGVAGFVWDERALDKIYSDIWIAVALVTLFTLVAILVVQIPGVWMILAKPLNVLNDVIKQLMDGNLSLEVPYTQRHDEVGSFAQAMRMYQEKSRAMQVMQDEQKQAAEEAQRQREQMVQNLAHEFEGDVNASVAQVFNASEEITKAIADIADHVQISANITREAVDRSAKSTETVSKLSQASEKIQDVVDLIRDIAEQTNLLALNAAIEAARAGDAGRGFAVVADEVKKLSDQTNKAVDDIGDQISFMLASTGDAVESLSSIRETITKVADATNSISATVEEQRQMSQVTLDQFQRLNQSVEGFLGKLRNS